MKALTVQEVKARYGLSKQELSNFLAEHKDKMPPGCKRIPTEVFNAPLIEFMDEKLGFQPDNEEAKKEANMQLVASENEDLKKQINKLKESYQVKENELRSSQKELRDMEDKFLHLQDSASAGNRQMIDKLRGENDMLKSKLANFENLKAEQLAVKDKRINELEELTADLKEIVDSNASLTDEKMKAELKVTSLTQKLLAQDDKISKSSAEKKALENEISRLKESKVITENDVVELQGTLNALIKSILGSITEAKLKLEGAEKTVTTIPEIKEVHHSVIEEPEVVSISETVKPETKAAPTFAEIRQDEDNESEEDAAAFPRTPSSF